MRRRRRAKPRGRQPRTRRGSRRESLLELIRQSDGLSRGEILERVGLKGDKSGEMSVSNALTALTKSNQVHREGGKAGSIAPPCKAQCQPPRPILVCYRSQFWIVRKAASISLAAFQS